VATLKAQVVAAAKDSEEKQTERQKILTEMASYQARVEKLPIREQQLLSLTRDYETSKANYRSLLDKKISAEMANDMERSQNSERFTVADPARPPETPIKPRRRMMQFSGILGGLAFGLLLGLIIEVRKDAFLGEWELPEHVLVVGRISASAPAAALRWGAQD
jgi:polysaccharide biosynthesis transport protein